MHCREGVDVSVAAGFRQPRSGFFGPAGSDFKLIISGTVPGALANDIFILCHEAKLLGLPVGRRRNTDDDAAGIPPRIAIGRICIDGKGDFQQFSLIRNGFGSWEIFCA